MALDINHGAGLTGLLRCPVTRQELVSAPADAIRSLEEARIRGELRDKSGNVVAEPVTEGLLTADKSLFYRVKNGMPVILPGEALIAG